MMDFLRKYQLHVLYVLLGFFIVYIALGFGSSFFVKGSPNDAIVEVDGEKIPLRLFFSHYQRALDPVKGGASLDEAGRKQKQDEAIRDLVQNVVFRREGERYGIEVPDQQVVNSLAQIPGFQTNGAFDPSLYGRVVQSQLRMSPQDFEEEQRTSVGFFKLRWLLQSSIKVTEKEMEMAYALHGAEFAQANKTMKREALRAAFQKRLWDDKVLWCFNQWFGQIGQKIRVKTHLELLEGGPR